ncbi:unnamed protein product [Diplocarpon coronariae]|nr:pyruvate carboxylase [Diplocarpon mali]
MKFPTREVAELRHVARAVGLPIIIKAVDGGGGRGIRIESPSGRDFADQATTNDNRHVEVPIVGDGHERPHVAGVSCPAIAHDTKTRFDGYRASSPLFRISLMVSLDVLDHASRLKLFAVLGDGQRHGMAEQCLSIRSNGMTSPTGGRTIGRALRALQTSPMSRPTA